MKKLLLVVLCLLIVVPASAAGKLTYIDLINKLIDLESLATLPSQGETCSQWSSWDRASNYDAKTGKYINWDANGDGQGIIRTEGDQSVFAEMEGPGCIWRIWSAAPKDGHVRIYLDGASEPAVDLPFKGYFDRQNQPFVYSSLVYDAASGKNCYIPIPYQKSCKIVADKDWGNYYHFDYTTYLKGTTVPTFKRDLSSEETKALQNVDDYLSKKLGEDPAGKRNGEVVVANKIDLLANKTSKIIELKGQRAITGIKIKIDQAILDANPDILREIAIRISWDGEKKPSVWSPLIDFFGTAPNANKYKSLPCGVTDDGFYSYWYMPFAKNAVVELVNDGKKSIPVEFSITHAPLTNSINSLARFHAKWHRDALLPKEQERWLDWTMIKTQGKGRFCGVAMHLWVPTGGWWGEGDEKFFVDGEKMPSFFGTGSEDYFGYAWGNPRLFQGAYHNQTRSDNNEGHVSLNRWQIVDNVPFQKSFDGYFEKYRSNARPALYSSVVYWYLTPDGTDPYNTVALSERIGYSVWPEVITVEGEKSKVNRITGGKCSQQMLDGRWSEGSNWTWHDTKPGDELVFGLPIKNAGKYDLRVKLTKAADYGIVQLSVDGKKVGDPIDLYNPKLTAMDEISIGVFDFNSDKHELSVQMVGTNDKSSKLYQFGIDYIKLAPIK